MRYSRDGDRIRGVRDDAGTQTYLRDCTMKIFEMFSARTAHPHSLRYLAVHPPALQRIQQSPNTSSIFRFYSPAAQPRLPEFLLTPN